MDVVIALLLTLVTLILPIGRNEVRLNALKVDHQTLPWWKSMLIYNVYPKSFKDSNGDGVGDFNGITQKLQHFVDMKVDYVWLNPYYPSPGQDNGYDISNFTAIDPIYGTMDDFTRLIREMKKLDLKFMMDLVINHCSDEHIWFEKSVQRIHPYTDYFIWKDPKGYDKHGNPIPPNNWETSFFGSAWTWVDARKQFYYHAFSNHQPDLNMRNPLVIEEIKTADSLEESAVPSEPGVTGIRVDAPRYYFEDEQLTDEPDIVNDSSDIFVSRPWEKHHYTADLQESYDVLRDLRTFVEEEYTAKDGEERIFIVEIYTTVKYTQKWIDYGHLAFNFDLQMMSPKADARVLDETVKTWKGVISTYAIDSHDITRTAIRFGEEFVDIFYMILTMLPGNVCIYYGQEIGMTGMTIRPEQIHDKHNPTLSRDVLRTPMQWDGSLNAGFSVKRKSWLPVNPNYWRINLEQQKNANVSHYKILKSLLELRKTPTSKYGKLDTYVLAKWVWAFTRTFENANNYVVVVNIGTEAEVIDLSVIANLPAKLKVLVSTINSEYKSGDIVRSKPMLKSATTLPPKSGLVLSTNIGRAKNGQVE